MVNINKLFLRQDTTLNEAIKTIDRGAAQIGLVVDNEKIIPESKNNSLD